MPTGITANSPIINTTYIEFTQGYENGSVLNVSNSSVAGVYPDSPGRLGFRFPDINDAQALLAIILKLRGRHKVGDKQMALPKGQEFAIMESYLNAELDELAQRGWVGKDDGKGERRLTVKGAVMMTWKLGWPVKQILNKRDLARSERALNSVQG